MKINVGCELTVILSQPTPLLLVAYNYVLNFAKKPWGP